MLEVRVGRGRYDRHASRQQRAVLERERLLAATEELLRSQSPHLLTVTQIVARSRVGRNTFYRHFEHVPALLEQLRARMDTELVGSLWRAVQDQHTPLARLEAIAAAWLECAGRWCACHGRGAEFDTAAGLQELELQLRVTLEQARRAGLIGRAPEPLRLKMAISAWRYAGEVVTADASAERRRLLADVVLRLFR